MSIISLLVVEIMLGSLISEGVSDSRSNAVDTFRRSLFLKNFLLKNLHGKNRQKSGKTRESLRHNDFRRNRFCFFVVLKR